MSTTRNHSILQLRDARKTFARGTVDEVTALDGINLDVYDQDYITIIGSNGAGKSTLLNIIAQIDVPSNGEILFKGEVIITGNSGPLRPGWGCRIGYVTQDDNLLPWRTLIENVLFPFRVQGALSPETRERAAILLKATGLDGFERFYPHELSGGMRKRAALIRTLVYDPPVILMDEPFGALDAQTRTQLQSDLLRLWNLGRKTIIFVTHDIVEAIALADRTLVLTRAPARVAGEHVISIPRPREMKNIYGLQGFTELFRQVREEIQ